MTFYEASVISSDWDSEATRGALLVLGLLLIVSSVLNLIKSRASGSKRDLK